MSPLFFFQSMMTIAMALVTRLVPFCYCLFPSPFPNPHPHPHPLYCPFYPSTLGIIKKKEQRQHKEEDSEQSRFLYPKKMGKKTKRKKFHKFIQLHNTKKLSLVHLPSTTPLLLLFHNTKKFSLMHLPCTNPLLLLHVSHCQFQLCKRNASYLY